MGGCTSVASDTSSTLECDISSRLRFTGHEATLSTESNPRNEFRSRVNSTDSETSRSPFVLDSRGNISQSYDLSHDKIGAGAFGFVFRGIHKTTGAERAVKRIIQVSADDSAGWRQEVAFLGALDHPNVIRLFETIEDSRSVYLAMELAEGGDLFDRILAAKRFGEDDAGNVMRDVLRAVRYLHGRDIAHRDLKPENFLLLNKGPVDGNVLKLADFGSATICLEGQVLKSKVGTAFYVAPQVLLRRYSRECDLWSAGVLMFVVLAGSMPFPGRSDAEVLARVRQGCYSFSAPAWRGVSRAAKELIRSLLSVSVRARFTAEQALNHRWLKDDMVGATPSFDEFDFGNFEAYSAVNEVKKYALQIIARQVKDREVKGLRDLFIGLDANNDGVLTEQELISGMEQQGLAGDISLAQRLFRLLASNGKEGIPYTEFIAAASDPRSLVERDLCRAAFSVFDLNGDGRISLEELEKVLHQGADEGHASSLKSLLTELDIDGDGGISFQEFMAMMRFESARHGVPRTAVLGGA